ncbi:hypothetical protein DINM_004529 [Dirofilaria immitis]|nr:hypothetical protein [Dirofilaria immitis]
MYNEWLLIHHSEPTFQIEFPPIVLMQRIRSKKLKKQEDEGEITEFEEVEVVRRPARSRMRSKLKWKRVLPPPKPAQTEITVTTTEGTSTTTSSTTTPLSTATEGTSTTSSTATPLSTASLMLPPPSLYSPVTLKPDITCSHESEEEANKLVAEDEDEQKKVNVKGKAVKMESMTGKTRRKLAKMDIEKRKILCSRESHEAGKDEEMINKFIERSRKQEVITSFGSETPQVSTATISTASTMSSPRPLTEKAAKIKQPKEIKSKMPEEEREFMKLPVSLSDTQSSQSLESEAESESYPDAQSFIVSNETVPKQTITPPISTSVTEKESVWKLLTKSVTSPSAPLKETITKEETKPLTPSLLESFLKKAAQLRIITSARTEEAEPLNKLETELSIPSAMPPIKSIETSETQQPIMPPATLKEFIAMPEIESPTPQSSLESPEKPETELSIPSAMPPIKSVEISETQQQIIPPTPEAESPTQRSLSLESLENQKLNYQFHQQCQTQQPIIPPMPEAESSTQRSLSLESLEKPETELSIPSAMPPIKSVEVSETQQPIIPPMPEAESPTQRSLSLEPLEKPETELSIPSAMPPIKSVETSETQQPIIPPTPEAESPTQRSLSLESLEKPETELSIPSAMPSIKSFETSETQQQIIPPTPEAESSTQRSLSLESLEKPETELSIPSAMPPIKSVEVSETQQQIIPPMPEAESPTQRSLSLEPLENQKLNYQFHQQCRQ